ncbi:SMP-30/gluconolactonase/LRE family protein [Herbiconiux sp. 11R-BC]|uniref:SMP-30/gluconolactonase/LRE family protein n=1 Tax=Herbiconiux sp. 11R-BC TaxID=3111637 RepID=UPI003C04E17D
MTQNPDDVLAPDATLEELYSGASWGEGPVWLAATQSLRWSDIPADRILEFDSRTGETRVHREGVEFTNGRTLDLEGRVVQCSHGRRAVEREIDGVPTTIVDSWNGKRLNSPNDVIVASDGAIWFTDPPYGIVSTREGHLGEAEYGGCWVFRHDEATGETTAVVTDMLHPNGLALSPDESVLYVSDTSSLQLAEGRAHIRAYDLVDGGAVNPRVFAEVRPGVSDGFRIDELGRLWSSSEDSVQVFRPDGERVAVIPVPQKVGNLCFGGPDGRDLYIAASRSLYRIRTATRQAPRPPRAARMPRP